MRLADFILANIEPILAEWEIFARSMRAGEHLDQLTLRDNASDILQLTARDMKSSRPLLSARRNPADYGNKAKTAMPSTARRTCMPLIV